MSPAAGELREAYLVVRILAIQDGSSVPLHLGLRDTRYASPDTKRERLPGKVYRSRAETAWSERACRDSFARFIGNIRAGCAQK